MREEDGGGRWFSRWEEQLPSPDELMPLSQTLITPDLAMAFDIPTAMATGGNNSSHLASNPHHHHHSISPSDFDSSDLNSGGGAGSGGGVGGGDEPARTLKRPRLVWTPQLHKRFVDAVAHLGIKNAVPKTIMQLMSVEGLTRENVASHLQKYRLYLKRMQGISVGGGGGAGSVADAATDQLFASTAVPAHFLRPGAVSGAGGGASETFLPYVPVGALQHQITAMQQQHQQQQQYYQQRNLGQFGYSNGAGGFDHGFLSRAMPQPAMHRAPGIGMGMGLSSQQAASHVSGSYIEELESGGRGGAEGSGGGARKVLTLFPTADD